ncbi:MAG: class I SAM-dependent methyltransferase [Blastocatellia bacterium]
MSNQDTNTAALARYSADMKRDWDWRARENAKWFINTYKLDQSDEEFYETGRRDFAGFVLDDLAVLTEGRDPRDLRVLEIGSGIGRITRHLADHFGEIHAIDVSGEMVRQGAGRFRAFPHVRFHETSGCDFAIFPDGSFDLIISFYVFQHIPDAAVIAANIRDAYRVLAPGGVFKFLTSGITSQAFQRLDKDTWTGAAFPEANIRGIARETGAQLLGVTGAGTQYCWTLLRKRLDTSMAAQVTPVIVDYGRAGDLGNKQLPDRTGETWLGMVIAGISREEADINNLAVILRDRLLEPCYVGRRGGDMSAGAMLQINVRIPDDEPGGAAELRVHFRETFVSAPVTIDLPAPQAIRPHIQIITNVPDGGLDLYTSGPKSEIRLRILHPAEQLTAEQVSVQLDGDTIAYDKLKYLPNNAAWEITLQLPADVTPGDHEFRVTIQGVQSEGEAVSLLRDGN